MNLDDWNMSVSKNGSECLDSEGSITARHGCERKVSRLSDHASKYQDCWEAWVNAVQDDGLSRNEAIRNAFDRSQ